ncbi:MAG: quinone oxidoreductase [Elusimicrobia bacterium RIFCSPLOWO2_01_FULL_60_11]|nr:MAG: quinone oxidoreductase [Elusimicrobia bacterium RIFCSPLOWO2_01_FULL_60_11]
MQAIRVKEFGGPEVMRLEDVPTPKPGPGEVLVKIKAAGVNPVDTYLRTGAYAYKPVLPYTPGADAGGVVESAGEGVKGLKSGSRVYLAGSLTGTYAESALCKVSQVHPIPPHISFSQAAGINVPYATAYRALNQRMSCRAGETMLVHGASGGVGVAAVQLGHAMGLCVIGTASTERGRALVKEAGAHHVSDHSKTGYLTEVLNMTGGKGVDVILEMLANVNLNNDLTILARGGRIVVIGSRGKIEIDPRLAMGQDANIHGMSLMTVPEDDLYSIHCALVAGLENKTLNPVVGVEIPLKDAARAHIDIMKPGSYGKIVLIP